MSECLGGHASPRVVVPVILSGGSGSRLWPLSRKTYPKQFWPLMGEKSLLQEAALRSQAAGLMAPVVVCSADHRFIVAEQLRDIGVLEARIILEPVARNSAPAALAAAHFVASEYPNAVLWIMTADAAIQDQSALIKALHHALYAAKCGHIVTFGMKPTYPETGYGYIEYDTVMPDIPGVYNVKHFIEKPSHDKAHALLKKENILWNSGMFVVSARRLLEEAKIWVPSLYKHVEQAVEKRKTDLDFIRLDTETFSCADDISLDYAIIERTEHAVVVPGHFGWSDIGSWQALWMLGSKDNNGNVFSGNVFSEETRGCYIRSEQGMTVATIGIDDLAVIVTQDAVMVSHRDRVQSLGKIVPQLQKEGYKAAYSHNRVYRPWGFYEILTSGEYFQVKRIMVKPGQKLSLQKHQYRAEHWVVVEGTALVQHGDTMTTLHENESTHLPIGVIHRLENPTSVPLTVIEVQSGEYVGEDDIIRLDDIYHRD